MYNFNFDVNDFFDSMPSGIWAIGVFFGFILIVLLIAIYVVSSLGIMKLADKNKIPNSWLAFIPCARYYLIGKLGFEVYPEEEKKSQALTWVLFGLSVGVLVFNSKEYCDLLKIAVTTLNAIAFYNIFKVITPKNKTGYTIATVILETLGGVFVYYKRNEFLEIDDSTNEESDNSEDIEEEIEEPKPKAKTKKVTKEVKTRPNFCPNCGAKINKTAKFCGNCGEEIK